MLTPSHHRLIVFLRIILGVFALSSLSAQQIDIPRIEQMPNFPEPYQMRDWREVARGYDSLVFDFSRTGEYLPLIWRNTNTVNYPNHDSFGLHTVVGTPHPFSAEAINVLPAVIGATLAGIDKSDQNGENWVLMCEEFFNRRPEENIYLNHPVAQSGSDWWYETMPNVFFYQLHDLYPGSGDFANQFTTVADQWLRAVQAMGGSATPWTVPYMNYRAWSFSTMTPLASGVREPEAAGAIAWILYHAYGETGEEKYRRGAEWAMEFLNSRTSNPSYELQLAYGVYAAARMNAELGTRYDLEKLLNWCFAVGPLRSWGMILGTWGGYDVSGVIGEVSGNDYAFLMNGFEQAGALVPLVRYDDRFSRAVGRWVLHLANASRLFYSNYLPPENQDSESWSYQYDPRSYIGHEALRESWLGNSPFATGDAISGGWGNTNLTLYSSSHVGIPGGIIDTTGIAGILRLDLLKTDYFHRPAYPTYLYFNPYDVDQQVVVAVGDTLLDLYDAAANRFLARGVSGTTPLTLPADQAVQLVLAPAGGTAVYRADRLLINGVVVDYRSGQPPDNHPPRIKGLASALPVVFRGEESAVYCTAEDRDGDALTFNWQATAGTITGSGATVTWVAPEQGGVYDLTAVVDDGRGGRDTSRVSISVLDNRAPLIHSLTAMPTIIDPEQANTVTCLAEDPDGDSLFYAWQAGEGTFSGGGPTVTWTAPAAPGYYWLICRVSDESGAVSRDSLGITVGRLVAHYRFNGDGRDESGFANHGTVFGATAVADRFEQPQSAFAFDGSDDYIRIPAHPSLDFREAMSLNFWMTISRFTEREAFPISHGSWQNRWKVSLIPDKRLRWTVKTTVGVTDLDTPAPLTAETLYNVAVTYGEGELRIYLNGQLQAGKSWGGELLTTNIDLTIAQMLPGDNQYNFPGELDDVRIYNRVLSEAEIRELYDLPSGLEEVPELIPRETRLFPNFPNPFNPQTAIRYQLADAGPVRLTIYNLLGQAVRTLVHGRQAIGHYTVHWDGRDEQGKSVASGLYFYRLETEDYSDTRKMIYLR